MSERRKARRISETDGVAARPSAWRGLLIGSGDLAQDSDFLERLGPAAEKSGVSLQHAGSLDDALARIESSPVRPDIVVVICNDTKKPIEFAHECFRKHNAISIVIAKPSLTLSDAVDAMRAGAADVIDLSASAEEIARCVDGAVERAVGGRHRDARLERLRKTCRKLNNARQDLTSHVSSMCTDLVDAYRELSTQIDHLAVVAEFNGLIRHELDIESLLRVALEFLLGKSGPTNAAVFLPSAANEFSLGAYVNLDVAPESSEMMFDHLAESLAPRFEHEESLTVLDSDEQIEDVLGENAHWLTGKGCVVFSCHQDGECLAVVALFRDARNPFPRELPAILDALAAPFASQLGRIIHVHHRHLPKDEWGQPGDAPEDDDRFWEQDDDLDLAA